MGKYGKDARSGETSDRDRYREYLSQLTVEFRLIALHRQVDLPAIVDHVEVVSDPVPVQEHGRHLPSTRMMGYRTAAVSWGAEAQLLTCADGGDFQLTPFVKVLVHPA